MNSEQIEFLAWAAEKVIENSLFVNSAGVTAMMRKGNKGIITRAIDSNMKFIQDHLITKLTRAL
jgi:hypothetical protein